MSDDHGDGSACCEECAKGLACSDSCRLAQPKFATVKGWLPVPNAFKGPAPEPEPAGQAYIGSSLGMGSFGQGYIGADLAGRPYTFGATPYPYNAAEPALAPYNTFYDSLTPMEQLSYNRMTPAQKAAYEASRKGMWPAPYQAPIYPAGFSGTLTTEQRNRMLAVLTPADRATYDGLDAAHKATFESDFADAHWDVINGTSRTAAEAAQTTAYLGATERALGLTFGTISTYLSNNNQQELERIRGANERAIHEIDAQLAQAMSPEREAVLRAQLAGFQQTQTLLETQRRQNEQQKSQTLMYVGIGGAVLLVGGGLAIWALTRSPRHNPVVGRGRNRHYEKPKAKRRVRARA